MTRYHRAPIHPALAPYVEEILIQDSSAPILPGALRYPVLPRPYPVIGFQYRGRLGVVRQTGPELLSRSGITGLQMTARFFEAQPETRSILVTLKSYGAFALFDRPMDDIAGNHVGMDLIAPAASLRSVEEKLAESPSPLRRVQVVSAFLLKRLEDSRCLPHPVVLEATKRILNSAGGERIQSLATG